MNTNERNLNQLRAAVEAKTNAPVYMTSKAQIVEHYKNAHGEKGFSRAIAEQLYGSIKNAKGENASVKSIMRRFQGERLTREGKGEAYKQLGRSLPAIRERSLKGNSITIHIEGKQNRYGGAKGQRHITHTSQRSIDITLTGTPAYDFIQDPSFDALWDEYGVDLGDDGEYSLQGASVS